MTTALALFTRDLRVHDHPALAAAARADRVVPLFVLDDRVADAGFLAPNRARFLCASLTDLDRSLRDRGAGLVVRRGDVVGEVTTLVRQLGVTSVHLSADVSRFAQQRQEDLREALADIDVVLEAHPGVTVVPPGEIATTSGQHYKVFTPYWNVWSRHRPRDVVPAPASVRLPDGLDRGDLPVPSELAAGDGSPRLPAGGESAARERLEAWLGTGPGTIEDYEEGRDRLADDGTSTLSPYLHFGNLSPRELVARLDRRRRGHDDFLRQVCWRDFHHQVTWAHPTMAVEEYRTKHDQWNDDPQSVEFTAWTQGRTGYPIVDAAMRQLHREGWMHNRARMIAASFLVKHLYADWRLGAEHFLHWLVDGDIANNSANWQWIAGTGTDSRPNRVYNPTRQAERYDPDGAYVRRYLPELAAIDGKAVHTPWELDGALLGGADYPPPIVDHAEAVARFRAARGLD